MGTFRTVRNGLLVLPLLLAGGFETAAADDRAHRSRLGVQGVNDVRIADLGFSSGFELFYAGPQWFVNALPGSGATFGRTARARGTSSIALDREGSEAAYVDSQHDVFDVSLFNIGSFFAGPSSRKTPDSVLFALGGSATWSATPTNGNWVPTISETNWNTGAGNFPGATSGTNNPDAALFLNSSVTGINVNGDVNIRDITFGTGATAPSSYSFAGSPLHLTSGGEIAMLTLPAGTTFKAQEFKNTLVLEPGSATTAGTYSIRNSSAASSNRFDFQNITGGTTTQGITLTLQGTSIGGNRINGVISDGGAAGGLSIVKNNGGLWILGGNNTFTGGVTINAGTLRASSSTAIGQPGDAALTFGSGSTGIFQLNDNSVTLSDLNTNGISVGTPIIENGGFGLATLIVTTTGVSAYAGVIQNGPESLAQMALTKAGAGTLILSGANTYTGNTLINAGDLRFNLGGSSNNSIIRLGDTAANSPSATLSLSANGGNNITSALDVRFSSGGGTRVLRSLATSGTNTYSGVITLNTGLTLESATNGTLLLQGGSINVNGRTLTVDSQVDFNGADGVNMRGNVIINELLGTSGAAGGLIKDGSGTLILQHTANTYTGSTAAAVASNPTGTRIAGGVLGIFGDGSLGLVPNSPTNNIFFTASAASNPTATRTLQATGGNITLNSSRLINVASGVVGTFDNFGNSFTINGQINGSGGIATTGSGSVTLTTFNTYTGGTTVQGGTLFANNPGNSATGSGFVTVNNGGTLSGNGTINTGSNTVTINGTVAPGAAANTVGALTLLTSSTVFGSNSTFSIDLGGNVSDQLLTSGTFNLLAIGDTIQFNLTAPLTEASYTLALYNGPALGVFDNVVNLPTGYTLFYNPTGELDLIATPIPEASTWIGAALALLAIGFTQRKRFHSLLAHRA